MAMQLEVNPNTVMRTYEYLQGKEIILNKRGVGYFVSPDGVSKATQLRKTEFFEISLPEIFKTAQLLNISFEELQQQYDAFNKKTDAA
jgi:DNA-binding transcriptional regulator YhcF (GntR family)